MKGRRKEEGMEVSGGAYVDKLGLVWRCVGTAEREEKRERKRTRASGRRIWPT